MLQTGRYTEIPVVSRSVSGVSIRGEFIAVSADSGLHCKKIASDRTDRLLAL